MLMQRRLFWVSVGAGAAFVVWLIAYFSLAYATRDDRVLEIETQNFPEMQEKVIAAVTECKGRFKMELSSHGNVIVIPLNALDRADYACLIDKVELGNVLVDEHRIVPLVPGKVVVTPHLVIRDAHP